MSDLIQLEFPAEVGGVLLIAFDGTSYVDATGDVYASPDLAAAPSADDAAAAVADPQLPPATPLPVPAEVGRAQLYAALLILHGIEEAAIETAVAAVIASLPPADQAVAQILWTKASGCKRDNALILAAASIVVLGDASIGLTADQVDTVFRFAATI